MNIRLAAGLCVCLVLGGCSDLPNFSDLLNFSSGSNKDNDFPSSPAVASAAPAPAAPGQPDPFCLATAQQGAQQGGFDPATQQRMIQRGYQQCVTLYRTQ